MLAVLLALAAAAGYGGSDYAAGLAARQASVIRVTILAEAISLVVIIAVLPLDGLRAPSLPSLAWGAAGGAGGALGALALYAGFRHAAFSVAGPLSAVGAAGFSVLVGQPGDAGQPTGAGQPAAVGRHAAGVTWGLVAGACFAVLFIALNRAGSGSGLWPVAAAQVAALVIVSCIGAARREVHLPAAGARWLAVVTGVTAAGGTILYFLATHAGLLAVTAVITSLYPAVTIVLARVFVGERLTMMRLAGLSLAAASVGLIAAGGAG